jgi:hypothetical protein
MLNCRKINCVGGRRNAQSASLSWEPQVGDAVEMDKGHVVMVLDVVVNSCSVKQDIPVTQIKRYFEKINLVCRGSYSSGGGRRWVSRDATWGCKTWQQG